MGEDFYRNLLRFSEERNKILDGLDFEIDRTKKEAENITEFTDSKIKNLIELFEETLKGLNEPYDEEEK